MKTKLLIQYEKSIFFFIIKIKNKILIRKYKYYTIFELLNKISITTNNKL